jgi:hypothetical protein
MLSRNRAVMVIVVAAIVVGRAAHLSSEQHHSAFTTWLDAGTNLLAVLALSWLVTEAVFGPGRVTPHRIRGAIVLYFNFAVGFSLLYELVAALSPRALSGLSLDSGQAALHANMLYFSLSTLTTTGYGDLVPVEPVARSLANLESVIGQLYPTTLLGRIVTLAVHSDRP